MTLDLTSFAPSQGTVDPRARFGTTLASRSLNGTWKFHYATSLAAAPTGVEAPGLDDSGWDDLVVPSSWPMHGYGAPAYTNVQFPFPVDPPHVPDENGIGDHRLRFVVTAEYLSGARLRFDGVDNAGEVWLNGTHLGSTRGSRLAQEFDVTGVLVEGENVLVVRVAQWSAASYLEDQDMWWLPGIFRDVTLLAHPAGAVEDVFVHTGFAGSDRTGRGTLRVEVSGADPSGDVEVAVPELGLTGRAGEELVADAVEGWTAETPRLYELTITTPVETVTERVGFRTVSWDGTIRVNGHKVLFRGVNRHEHHPDLGRVVPADVLRDELRLMKQHNVNAIRTSHYPPHPDLLDLADELGFWVIDECDQETHGFGLNEWRQNPIDDPRYTDALLDRARRTVERDKNRPCVVGWSLGNESFDGANITAMAAQVHARDDSRFVHYEGQSDAVDVDVMSQMYPHPDRVAAFGRREEPPTADPAADAHRRSLPYILCEYVHAMGNGPGGIAEYQTLFETHERLNGGFVWEWVEHGIRKVWDGPDGPVEYFGYGGDFGEVVHDGNFVCDGLVSADRVPRPGLVDWKTGVQPLRMTVAEDWAGVEVRSVFDFTDASHLVLQWRVDGPDGLTASGPVGPLSVPAGESRTYDLPAEVRDGRPEDAGVLTVSAVVGVDLPWAPVGHEVAWSQAGSTASPVHAVGTSAPRSTGTSWTLGSAEFSATTGRLTSLAGLALDGPTLNLWRAPTDNDHGRDWSTGSRDADVWERQGLHRLTTRLVSINADGEALVVVQRVAAPVFDRFIDVTYRWSADESGVAVDVTLDPHGDWGPSWARIGLDLTLGGELGDVSWSGFGPGQKYPDTGLGQRLGWWSASVADLQVPYVRPQENGSRVVTGAVTLAGAGRSLTVSADEAFSFTARPWSQAALAAAEHTYELVPDGRTHLTLDHRQHGIGTAACGPGVLPAYVLDTSALGPDDLRFRLVLSAS